MTINEGLAWLKVLRARHAELINLRDANASTSKRYYGNTDREVITEPKYDVKKLDILVTNVAKQIRLCDAAIKKANVLSTIEYTAGDDVLGNVE